jgi:glycosyltransferase involved in cell wall biosynthesis
MKKILFIGQFPMPRHGVSVINEFIFENLSGKAEVVKYDYRFNETLKGMSEGSILFKVMIFLKHFLKILKVAWKEAYDIIYFTPNIKGDVFFRDLIIVQIFRFTRSEVYLHLHGLGVRERNSLLFSIMYRCMFSGNNVIHVSKKVLDDEFSISKYGGRSFSFLNNSVDYGLISSKYLPPYKGERCTLIHMANLRQSKGSMDVLRVFRELRKKIDCTLLMVGEFSGDEFESAARSFVMNEHLDGVEFLGFLEGEDKYSVLSSGTLFIYPSYNDSFGLVVLEAQAVGLPVCAYDVGSMQQIVNTKTGVVIPLGNLDAMVDACEALSSCGRQVPDDSFFSSYDLNNYMNRLAKIMRLDD